jgi:hypothetical protein
VGDWPWLELGVHWVGTLACSRDLDLTTIRAAVVQTTRQPGVAAPQGSITTQKYRQIIFTQKSNFMIYIGYISGMYQV